MNKLNFKKLLTIGLTAFAALAVVLVAPVARADSDHHDSDHGKTPKIIQVMGATATSAIIDFRDSKFRNKEVIARISIKSQATGIIMEKDFTITLNEDGKGTVTVTGLATNAEYKFKVKVMKVGGEDFTLNSHDKELER